jgi:5'-3' exonuclease
MGIPGFFGKYILKHVKHAIIQNIHNVSSLSIDLNSLFHAAFSKIYMISILENGEILVREGEKLLTTNKQEGEELIKQGQELIDRYNNGKNLVNKGNNHKNRYQGEQMVKEGQNIMNEKVYMKRVGKSDDLLDKLEDDYHHQVWILITNIVNKFTDLDTLILAVDGVAPGGKLKQQRQRRFKSALNNNASVNFDSNVITPGTEFMIRLSTFLTKKINTNRNSLPHTVIYSSHLVEGEGEHKIMEYYRLGQVKNLPGNHVLYGLDADLIMLSLLSPQDKIILYRESDISTDILSIDLFKQHIQTKTNVDDFVFMTFMLGNDFLPHHFALEELAETIELMLDIYKDNQFSFIKNNLIDYNQFHLFLVTLAQNEQYLLTQLSLREDYQSVALTMAKAGGQFDVALYRQSYYDKILLPKNNTIKKIVNDSDIKNMVTSYLRTMSWNYLYYTEGMSAVNQDWVYEYYYSPMLVDIAFYSQDVNIIGYKAWLGMVRFNPLHQLLSVIPKSSIDAVPNELKELYKITSPLYDLFPTTFINDKEGRIHKKPLGGKIIMDHGIAIIPIPDRRRIYHTLKLIDLSVDRSKLWLPDIPLISTVQKQQKPIYRKNYVNDLSRKMNTSPRPDLQQKQNIYYQPRLPSPQVGQNQPRYQQVKQTYQPVQQQPQYQQIKQTYQPVQQQPQYQRVKQTYQPIQQQPQYQPKQVITNEILPQMINLDVITKYIHDSKKKSVQDQLNEEEWY